MRQFAPIFSIFLSIASESSKASEAASGSKVCAPTTFLRSDAFLDHPPGYRFPSESFKSWISRNFEIREWTSKDLRERGRRIGAGMVEKVDGILADKIDGSEFSFRSFEQPVAMCFSQNVPQAWMFPGPRFLLRRPIDFLVYYRAFEGRKHTYVAGVKESTIAVLKTKGIFVFGDLLNFSQSDLTAILELALGSNYLDSKDLSMVMEVHAYMAEIIP